MRLCGRVVEERAAIGLAPPKVHEVLRRHVDRPPDDLGVIRPGGERHDGRAVAEHGVPNLLVELGEELVGEGKLEPALAGFRKDGGDHAGAAVLKFVYYQIVGVVSIDAGQSGVNGTDFQPSSAASRQMCPCGCPPDNDQSLIDPR